MILGGGGTSCRDTSKVRQPSHIGRRKIESDSIFLVRNRLTNSSIQKCLPSKHERLNDYCGLMLRQTDSVEDGGPTLSHHCLNILCLLSFLRRVYRLNRCAAGAVYIRFRVSFRGKEMTLKSIT